MELNLIVKQVLLDIDFINRYEALSKEYSPEKLRNKTPLKYLDGELVMDMISEAGYIPGFDPKEKFFKFYEKIEDYRFGLHIVLYTGTVELIWAVKDKEKSIAGMPWGIYSRLMIDPDYRIKMPNFSDYDELEDILKTAFTIYEDFKQVFLEVAEVKQRSKEGNRPLFCYTGISGVEQMIDKIDFLNKYTLNEHQVEILTGVDSNVQELPKLWQDILAISERQERVKQVLQYWQQKIGKYLINTTSYLSEYLYDVEVMKIGQDFYLLYTVVGRRHKVMYYAGGNPNKTKAALNSIGQSFVSQLPESLKKFYFELHDGFYYYPSRSMGLEATQSIMRLADEEWGILEDGAPVPIDLSSSYSFFTNGMGRYVVLDLSEGNPLSEAVLWDSSAPARYHLDFWAIVDEWITIGFDG